MKRLEGPIIEVESDEDVIEAKLRGMRQMRLAKLALKMKAEFAELQEGVLPVSRLDIPRCCAIPTSLRALEARRREGLLWPSRAPVSPAISFAVLS